MGQIKIKDNIDYIIFFCALAFTTFEYFFREASLFNLLVLFGIVLFILKSHKFCELNKGLFLILFFGIIYFLQGVYNGSIITAINRMYPIVGSFCIATIICKRFEKVFINTIAFIATYSIIIYLLCFIPSINNFLMYNLASKFTSLNVESAVFEGGGINFIIYNFQTDLYNEVIGFSRNCGPFWEPGMFAVFLNIALFFNIYLGENKQYLNILFLVNLLTTFSTGGYIAAMFIGLIYVFTKNKSLFLKLLSLIVLVSISVYIMSLEYIGDKLIMQMETADMGGDESRFSAILTQIEMIKASPFIGGESIEEYAKTTKTLASGFLMPLVSLGIPFGLLFYVIMYKSYTKLVESLNCPQLYGLFLFSLVLILSISQTILLQRLFIIIIFICLIKPRVHYGKV